MKSRPRGEVKLFNLIFNACQDVKIGKEGTNLEMIIHMYIEILYKRSIRTMGERFLLFNLFPPYLSVLLTIEVLNRDSRVESSIPLLWLLLFDELLSVPL